MGTAYMLITPSELQKLNSHIPAGFISNIYEYPMDMLLIIYVIHTASQYVIAVYLKIFQLY